MHVAWFDEHCLRISSGHFYPPAPFPVLELGCVSLQHHRSFGPPFKHCAARLSSQWTTVESVDGKSAVIPRERLPCSTFHRRQSYYNMQRVPTISPTTNNSVPGQRLKTLKEPYRFPPASGSAKKKAENF